MLAIVDEQVDVEIAQDRQLLAILEQRFRAFELRVTLLIAILDFFQRAFLRHCNLNYYFNINYYILQLS